ncbi:MAG: DNA-processing protein DprA [Gemmatimonadales bacterium]
MPNSSTISPAMVATRPVDPDERSAWLALASIVGLGPRRMAALLSEFESACGVLRAPHRAVREVAGIPNALARTIGRLEPSDGAKLEHAASAVGQQVLTPADAGYPVLLRAIPDPPLTVYVVGDPAIFNRPAVAIVGSRDHTQYGERVAATMGGAAGASGVVVVSGLARGLDAVAQAAALDAGGTTIGVLGQGADIVYPRSNAALFRRVTHLGMLLSEYPPGTEPTAGSFPRRNRLISGLARALVVVEAADGSGTMITVAMALEQGREVFAVPGPITGESSRGTNRLIRDGATPLLGPEDLLAIFGATSGARAPASPECTLSVTEARVFGALDTEPRHLDQVALSSGLPVGELLGTLLGLELGGLVEQLPGSRYQRR